MLQEMQRSPQRNIFIFNDGAGHFNGEARDLMMEHSNLTIEQLHHKTPYGDL